MNCPPKPTSDVVFSKDLLMEKIGYKGNEPIILYQGGFSPNRGLEQLVLSAKEYKKGILVFMGWGIIEDKLKELTRKEGLEDSVLFTGPAEQDVLLSYTAGADLGVIPYRFIGLNNYYTSPNKLFEYINANVPVVGSNFPELKRVILDYNIGDVFEPEDPSDIARAINKVLENKDVLHEMKNNTHKAAACLII